MTGPALAGKADDGSRFYTWAGERYWSVTTIIGGGIPKHLQNWAAKLVAELAWADLEAHPHGRNGAALRRWSKGGRAYVEALQESGELRSIKLEKLSARDLGLRYLKGEPDRVRDAAAARGTAVHQAAEEHVLKAVNDASRLLALGLPMPTWSDEIAPWMSSFLAFLAEWSPEYLAAEATVFHRGEAYAGTLDAIVRIPAFGAEPIVLDYKSGGSIYPDVALQLAAYARGEFIGLPDGVTTAALPAVSLQTGAVLHLTPKGYSLRPVRIDDDVFRAFLYAREVFRWATETSREVLLDELTPRREVA